MFNDVRQRLRALFRRDRVETELEDELQFHREQQLASCLRAGLSPDDARRRVALEFGGLEQMKEECRQARGVTIVEHLVQDVRYGLRSLRKTPGFTIVAVLTLGLGIGANTAMFSVVYGVLLRPLPYADASSLVVMRETTPKVGAVSVSYPDFLDWRAGSRAFSAMANVSSLDVNLGAVSQPETIRADAVSTNFLAMLGMRPLMGRDFEPREDLAGTARVALLTYGLWQSHFGGDRGVLGKTITLDGTSVEIIGVLPREFVSTDAVSLLLPLGMWLTNNDAADSRGSRGDTVVIGRLAHGVTLEQARTDMAAITGEIARAHPDTNKDYGAELQPIRDVFVGDTRPALVILFGAVICVLLIACTNVANLCLIRGAGRTREVAIGAGRGRILSQLLVESAVLASLGGLVGLALAVAALRGLAPLMADGTMGAMPVTLDGVVLAFAAGVVLASTMIFGLTPAIQLARSDVQTVLKDGGRTGSASRQQQRWRSALVTAEVSLALMLLVGAGLMMRSLSRLLEVDAGIRTDRVLTLQVELRGARYERDETERLFWQDLVDGVSRLPGVKVAALGSGVPMTNDHSRRDISIAGMAFPNGASPHPDVHAVTPGYVGALGITLLQGRVFTDVDDERAPRVGLINRSLAQKIFGRETPLGRQFTFGHPKPDQNVTWFTIVGVLDDTRLYGLDNPSRLEIYLPLRQAVRSVETLVVKGTGDPATLVPSIRTLVSSLDRDQPISNIATMDELVATSVSTRRITFVLLGLFSTLALALAALGIYGVMSYAVAQRTPELGIRLALGAQPWDVVKTIAAQALVIVGAGIVTGLGVSLGVTRLMQSVLFDVSALDPTTFATVGLGVAGIAAVACAIPGRRALRVDPLVALRRE